MSERKNFHLWTVVIVATWIAILNPGAIEGRMFPVVSDVSLHARPDASREDWVLVSGSAKKVRDNCSVRHLEWFLGQRDEENASVEYDWEPPKIREMGPFYFYDWSVRAAPPEVLMNESFADIIHSCFVILPGLGWKISAPWNTRTRLWR
jgi:hypothetical protein